MKKIKEKINLFNNFLAEKLSYSLSIMTTFYIIFLLVTIPLFYSQPATFVAWAGYLCSVIFQGIALPVLGYTARKASDKTDALMNDMYNMTVKIEHLVEIIQSQQDEMKIELDKIDKEVDEIDDAIKQ